MPRLLFFFQTDCPTCQLIAPYLNTAARAGASVTGLSQDDEATTRAFASAMQLAFPIEVDRDLKASRQYDPLAVPTLLLLDNDGGVIESHAGFDKASLNALASAMGFAPWARDDDGAPASKPGCTSRHGRWRAPASARRCSTSTPRMAPRRRASTSPTTRISTNTARGSSAIRCRSCRRPWRASRACSRPTPDPPHEVIGRIPPNYGAATVEKIAANAVMAGCPPRDDAGAGAARPRRLRRALQPARRAGDDALRRAAHRHQRSGAAGARVSGAGRTSSATSRARTARSAARLQLMLLQPRRRASARDRHVDARQSGQVLLLHRRERGGEPVAAAARPTADCRPARVR